MALPSSPSWIYAIGLVLLWHAVPAAAFGAGNIGSLSAIEGQNWRHGDIEDTLLTLMMCRAVGGRKFGKMDVKRVYFGNWLRDYSQAVDVGTVKYVSAEAIRLILWVLGFMSFGYGSREFEVTLDRLGCYRPEEHIDNPKNYADNLDARKYDRRLRGPVNERVELAINPQTGLKNYIANEQAGIDTSAGLVRRLFTRCIQLGRQYARTKNDADLFEALRLLGTGCHCLEDYAAHSNYVELALIELGERDVFPHTGRATPINLRGAQHPVYPIVTGTFGGTDFLHSVMGEFADKATQSELQELQGTMQSSQGDGNFSFLQTLLQQVPSGLFGGEDQAGKAHELQANAQAAQMQNMSVSPRQPEAWARTLDDISKQIYPIIEWHDEIMLAVTEFIESIPILPDLIEQLTDQVNIFVFTLLGPLILPIINQVKNELATGSSEIIQMGKDQQFIVWTDDRCSDPTHSMLSKDHFSNILNEPAGKMASYVLTWVVPQLMSCWDDDRVDPTRTINRIVNGVFHHPSLRDQGDDGAVDCRRGMFAVVERWWRQKDERQHAVMRDQLSRDGVQQGRNHKEGVQDGGHGCGKPIGLPTLGTATSSGAMSGLPFGDVVGQITSAVSGQQPSGGSSGLGMGSFAQSAVGGGALGAIVGGLAGGIGGNLLGSSFESGNPEIKTYQPSHYNPDGSITQSYVQTGYTQPPAGQQPVYGQASYGQTSLPDGGRRQEYQQYEQNASGTSGYGSQVRVESRPLPQGGYAQATETRFEKPAGEWESDTRFEGRRPDGSAFREDRHQEGRGGYRRDEDDGEDYERAKRHELEGGSRYGQPVHGQPSSGAGQPSYGAGQPPLAGYGERPSYGAGYGERREEAVSSGYGQPGYGRPSTYEQESTAPQQSYGASSAYGGQERRREDEYERREEVREEEFGERRGYGGRTEAYGERRQEEYGERRQEEYQERREEVYQERREEEYEERREEESEERRGDYGSGYERRGEESYGEGDGY